MAATKSHALIVGASATVGAEFARQLAGQGYSLALVARREGVLEDLADEIRRDHGVQVEPIALDLLQDGAVDALVERCREMQIDFLVCNANLHRVGLFEDLDLDTKLQMLRMNAELPVRLAHAFGPGMVARRQGNIVLINALNCMTALDIDSVFQGTKSFLLVFGESLWEEYRRHGVHVGVAMVSGIEGSESYQKKLSLAKRRLVELAGAAMSPRRIVAQLLSQLGGGECILIPDFVVPVNRAGFQMGLAVRSARSPVLTRALAGFYRWLLDGDEVENETQTTAKAELVGRRQRARAPSAHIQQGA